MIELFPLLSFCLVVGCCSKVMSLGSIYIDAQIFINSKRNQTAALIKARATGTILLRVVH
jgi:hypothetical protein